MKSEAGHRLELSIGRLLRIGVSLSAAVVVVGAALHLVSAGLATPHYDNFKGEPAGLTTIPGVIGGVQHGDSRSIIQLGLLLLIATPVARVVFSLVAFLHERDWLYSFFTLVVLSVLAYGLLAR